MLVPLRSTFQGGTDCPPNPRILMQIRLKPQYLLSLTKESSLNLLYYP